jgi:hypothetical protein
MLSSEVSLDLYSGGLPTFAVLLSSESGKTFAVLLSSEVFPDLYSGGLPTFAVLLSSEVSPTLLFFLHFRWLRAPDLRMLNG